MKMLNQVKITFAGRSVNEGFARAALAAFLVQLDPTVPQLADMKTAVSEAVTNCIVHAYPDTVGTIWMRVAVKGDNVLEIQIKDKGIGIPDVDRAREPLFTTGGDDRSGMGFTIMESFMDAVRVRSQQGKGTTVTLTRKIRRKAPIL